MTAGAFLRDKGLHLGMLAAAVLLSVSLLRVLRVGRPAAAFLCLLMLLGGLLPLAVEFFRKKCFYDHMA